MTASAGPSANGHHYHVFGLSIRSELPLNGLIDVPPGPFDVEIRYGTVPAFPDAPRGYHVTAEGTLLMVPDVARFWIKNGDSITVTPCPDASERNVRLFVLGSALGAILHQRGLVPLHANAIGIGGKAVAFMGHSGAGKSTMAAWFLDRGRPVLTDDVCVVDRDAKGDPIAHRGLVRLRLWREALERSGREAVESARSFDDQDKFDLVMAEDLHAPATLPFGAAVLLRRTEGDAFAIRRLRGMEAVGALMENIYRGGYAGLSGGSGTLLAACAGLAARVPVMEVQRAWGFDRYDEQAELIERALQDVIAR